VPVGSPADAAVVTPLARAESLERRVCLAATVMDATFGAGGAATVDVAGLLDSATTVEALVERAPAFAEASVLRGWAGFYEVTPDDNPLLGWTGGPEGLAVAAGFSGHGFMQGPAIGRCMAELLLDGAASDIEISPFRPSRFAEGAPTQEHNVI